MGLDHEVAHSQDTSAFIQSRPGKDVEGYFGTIMQYFFPKMYLGVSIGLCDDLGKRVRMTAQLRWVCGRRGWCGLWMRVEGPLVCVFWGGS